MSELDDLLKLHKTDDRMITHRELHKIANLARAEVERLRRLVRETRQLQLGWEVADAFDYQEQSSGECQTFVAAFNADTEAMIANTEEEQTR